MNSKPVKTIGRSSWLGPADSEDNPAMWLASLSKTCNRRQNITRAKLYQKLATFMSEEFDRAFIGRMTDNLYTLSTAERVIDSYVRNLPGELNARADNVRIDGDRVIAAVYVQAPQQLLQPPSQ